MRSFSNTKPVESPALQIQINYKNKTKRVDLDDSVSGKRTHLLRFVTKYYVDIIFNDIFTSLKLSVYLPLFVVTNFHVKRAQKSYLEVYLFIFVETQSCFADQHVKTQRVTSVTSRGDRASTNLF